MDSSDTAPKLIRELLPSAGDRIPIEPVEDAGRLTCEKHGEYQARVGEGRGARWLSQCPTCWRDAQARRVMGRAALPPRFVDRTFDSYAVSTPSQDAVKRAVQDYSRAFGEHAKTGRSVILCGRPGTGKTHLAAALLNEIIKAEFTGIYATVSAAIRRVKDTWTRGSERTEREVIADFVLPDLLILDEVGVQFGSDAERMILFEIINGRYEHQRPTMLISNLDIAGMEENVGTRAVDRLREGGGKLLTFDWESYRRTA